MTNHVQKISVFFRFTLFLPVIALALFSCGSEKSTTGTFDGLLMDQVEVHFRAIESGEMLKVDQTVHPASPYRENIMLEAEGYMYNPSKIIFALDRESSEVVASTDLEAYLYVHLDLSGSAENTRYRPNRISQYMRLSREGNYWYLVQIVTEKVEFTDLQDIKKQIKEITKPN